MISVRNLKKTYPGGVTALDGVSFEAGKSEVCGYIGTNGAGKSTTVKILIGVLEFDEGEVLIKGIDVRKQKTEVKKIVGYVPETSNLFNALTAGEYLGFTGKVRNIEAAVLNRRIDNFLRLFGIENMRNESIGNLSKGTKQKVLITSALIHNPDVIFFDEPLNGLDANSIFVFQDLVTFLVGKGKTILYCSHLLNTVEKVSSKIILIDKGKILLDTKTENLKHTENYSGLENLFRSISPPEVNMKLSYEGLFD